MSASTNDDAYWSRQRALLDTSDDIMHVNFAKFVADQCGATIRYVVRIGWVRWNGRVWEETGDSGAALNSVTDAAGVLFTHAGSGGRAGWAADAGSKLLNHQIRRAVVAEMEVLPELRADVDEMNCHRHLLTFQNGTVDLRSGELLPHDSSHMLTQCAPVDYVPDAPAPRWDRFIDEIFPGDPELQEYMQAFLGMCITGETRDHALGVWYGAQGRNGKGTIVRTMTKAFGTGIVHEVPYEVFENARGTQTHTESIAALRSARMVVAQEGNQGTPMNTARLKNWSGGDRIEARHLHGKVFSFEPKFNIILATNHLPEFSSGGAALWSRTKAVLFGQCFANRVDIDLEPTIQGPELEGVAAWFVRGAMTYYESGRLRDPLSVLEATEKHKDEVDPLKPLLGEVFDYDPESWVKRSTFNGELKEWASTNGEKSAKFSPSAVKRELMNRQITEVQKKGVGWCYVGIYLMSDPPQRTAAGPGIFDRRES